MNVFYSTLNTLRDRYAPLSHTSTFRATGQITAEEFVAAGDFLVYKFPSWSWADASPTSHRVTYLPPGKQFLVTRGVPCHRRLEEHYAAGGLVGRGEEEEVVRDGFGGGGVRGVGGGGEGAAAAAAAAGGKGVGGNDDDDGWLRTGGGMGASQEARMRNVRTVDEAGNVAEMNVDEEGNGDEDDDDDEIPDMEDEEDDEEAIIRDPKGGSPTATPLRTYTLYIMYTPYYRTPRLYLSGYQSNSEPLPPRLMMEDIVGDYKDKTVTLEDFPFSDSGIKMASVHPCKHASVMKVLLDRADAALKLRMAKIKKANSNKESSREGSGISNNNNNDDNSQVKAGLEGLVDQTSAMALSEKDKDKDKNRKAATANPESTSAEEWEVLQQGGGMMDELEEEPAIRVDQYLIVFLKFAATLIPTIEHDFTTAI